MIADFKTNICENLRDLLEILFYRIHFLKILPKHWKSRKS